MHHEQHFEVFHTKTLSLICTLAVIMDSRKLMMVLFVVHLSCQTVLLQLMYYCLIVINNQFLNKYQWLMMILVPGGLGSFLMIVLMHLDLLHLYYKKSAQGNESCKIKDTMLSVWDSTYICTY